MRSDHAVSIVGLGYVGLPIAVAFGRNGHRVIGFDIDSRRIAELRRHHDRTGEVTAEALAEAAIGLTDDPAALAEATVHIVTVPTPISDAKRPDLGPLLAASRTVGDRLKRGDLVVFESTVFPGATEAECVPILEARSGLAYGRDFAVGYSPERINPGDREHRFETITKVVSASSPEALDRVAALYGGVVRAGIHRAPSIAVAEAAKVIENTQRDLNIALMNELACIFQRLGIDTRDVLEAAGTKWNFLNFTPGLVGGHCIGVDPYYLTHRAEQAGYQPEVILAGRRINDGMGAFIAQETVKRLMREGGGGAGGMRVTVLGLTFKENVPDIRNTRVVDILRELESFGVSVALHDPLADPAEARHEYGIDLLPLEDLPPADAVILAVPHAGYMAAGWPGIARLLEGGRGLAVDVKSCLDRAAAPEGIRLWRL
ncbi:nucleotide sugar dehydrogenase [Skermanella pratensis]|uniref:nucleotide sugar dehydrogenase n=1 Tax=Skermanella pratensis TaxID=2233999 RepID=UPI001301618F|nr:nucleotide sugar dehydrogenase [Skermanella pratensis]